MTANVEAMVSAAIRAYRAGNKAEARALLDKVTAIDPENEQAWMWMSAVVDSPDDQRVCLENVLVINPNNANARRGLELLKAGTESAASQAAPSASPFTADSVSDYTVPTSSASATHNPANEPTSQQYDDWVSGLNLGSSGNLADKAVTVDNSDLDDSAFADVFATVFDDDEEEEEEAATPFDTGMLRSETQSAASSGPFSASSFGFDDDFEDDYITGTFDTGSKAPAVTVSDPEPDPSPSKMRMSPGFEAPPTKSDKPAVKRSAKEDTSDFYIGGEAVSFEDPGEFFRMIPAKIKPTRLPGTKERVSALAMLSLLGLAALNAGALALLAMNLAG